MKLSVSVSDGSRRMYCLHHLYVVRPAHRLLARLKAIRITRS